MSKSILISIDLGDEVSSAKVLESSLDIANEGDKLSVITVLPNFGMSVVSSFFPKNHETQMLDHAQEELHKFTEKYAKDKKFKHIIAVGTIYEEIIDNANKVSADLIVIGSHRPDLKDYLLGPNAARVVRHAKQSVYVVRS